MRSIVTGLLAMVCCAGMAGDAIDPKPEDIKTLTVAKAELLAERPGDLLLFRLEELSPEVAEALAQ